MLHELLGLSLEDRQIVSICGGGGKTTLLYALARESKGVRNTTIYTTTNIFVPDESDIEFVEPFSPGEACSVWDRGNIVCAGSRIPEVNKLAAPDENAMQWLLQHSDGIYIEADGSKRLPLKYPAAWEPVPMAGSDAILVVAGLSALEMKRETVVHRAFLAEQEIDYREPFVTEEGMARLLWAGYGRFNPVFVLNQADNADIEEKGQRIAERLIEYGARRAVVLALNNLYT